MKEEIVINVPFSVALMLVLCGLLLLYGFVAVELGRPVHIHRTDCTDYLNNSGLYCPCPSWFDNENHTEGGDLNERR